MKIVNFFEDNGKEYWLEEIKKCDWGAAKFLVSLLTENKFSDTLGEDGKLLLLIDGQKLVSFITLTQKDCIDDDEMFPWLGFLFTYPEYRGKRYSEKIINYACEIAKNYKYKNIYLGTDHVGLYEKYGFTYVESRIDVWGEDCRIYSRSLYE